MKAHLASRRIVSFLLTALLTWLTANLMAAPIDLTQLAFPGVPAASRPKDYVPIEVSYARTHGNPNRVEVVFSAPVAPGVATNAANYGISPPVAVQSAALGSDGYTVWLTTGFIPDAGLHRLSVTNVTDLLEPPNPVPPGPQVPILKAQNLITRKLFLSITGATVDALTNNAKFPNAPDAVDWMAGVESPAYGDNYGVQLTGFVHPPASGEYIFYIASDGQGLLYLSSDETPANRVLVASVAASSGVRDYIESPTQASPYLRLEAGRRYYLEVLMKESTGVDHVAVAWRMRGMPGPFTGDPPIPGDFLSSITPSAPASVVASPQNLAVTEGQSANFWVSATGTPPYTYRWLRNGAPVPLITLTNYAINPVMLADDGALVQGVVANDFSAATSSVATLSVSADAISPGIIRVSSGPTLDRVRVTFSEPVRPETASVTANYSLSGGLGVLSARLMPNRTNVILNTSLQTTGQVYTLTVGAVTDLSAARNPVNAASNFTAWVESRGFLWREQFLGLAGAAVSELLSAVEFPDAPDTANAVMLAETPSNVADNFGQRLVGLVLPPLTGNYRFYMASDAQGALYLSTDASPANKRLIATEPQYDTGPRDWVGTTRRTAANPENRSAPIYLVAGQKYFIEALMKEDSSSDNLGVTWQMPGDPVPANGAAPILAPFLACFADPTLVSLTITQQPGSLTIMESTAATFTVGVTSSYSPVFYQWQRGGADISGATNSSFTTPRLLRSDSGAEYRCLVSIPGAGAFSSNAVVTVTQDDAAPVLLSAGMLAGSGVVGVCFSELLDSASGTSPANYSVSGAQVTSARLLGDGQSVALSLSVILYSNLTLTVNGVKDYAGNPITANSTANVGYWPIEALDVGTPGTDPVQGGLALVCSPGNATVIAGGSDIASTKDAFHFVYDQREGDFDVQVQVAAFSATSPGAKAGLMAREDLSPGSRNALAALQPQPSLNRYFATWRLATNGATAAWPGTSISNGVPYPDAWLRLTRTGQVFIAWRGTNGLNWTQFAQATFTNFPARAHVGLATTANTNVVGRSATAIYRNYSASPAGFEPAILDMQVKRAVDPGSAYKLNDVYQVVPAGGQDAWQLATPASPASFHLQIEHEGTSIISPVLRESEQTNAAWTVTYRVGTTDISAQIRSTNGYTITNLIAGVPETVTVDLTPAASAPGNARDATTLSVFANRHASLPRDVVRVTAVNDPTYQPDLFIKRLSDVIYAGDDVYNATGANQTRTIVLEPMTTAVFHLRIVNDGNLTNQYRLNGGTGAAGWTLRYFDLIAGGVDITDALTNGITSVLLPPGGAWNFRLELTPGSAVPRGASQEVLVTGTSTAFATRQDTVKAIVQVQTMSPDPVGRSYTLNSDFDDATHAGTVAQNDQVQLASEPVTSPFIWVPNSNEGTVSKVDTITGREMARYRVGAGTASNPSRTTVDQFGSCYVANRNYGTVVKLGLVESGQYIDRNGNGVPDTSYDANGDGDITGGELLAWGQDECVLYEVIIIPGKEGTYAPNTFTGGYGAYSTAGARSIAADLEGNIWAGNFTAKRYYFIDGVTGQILRTNDLTALNHSPYGAIVDANGLLWSAEAANNVVWLDPVSNTATNLAIGHTSYGLGLDREGHLFVSGYSAARLSRVNVNTKTKDWTVVGVSESRGVTVTPDGDVWTANSTPGTVTRWSSDGLIKQHIAVGPAPTGVAVDADGKVWCVDLGDEYIHRIDPALNVIDLSKRLIGTTHYGYSDMTGFVSRNSTVRFGTWTARHDSRRSFTAWGVVTWNAVEPIPNSLRLRVRSSEDGRTWANWEPATNGSPLLATPPGRWVEVEASFRAPLTAQGPTLQDITIMPLPQGTADVSVATSVLPNPGTNEHDITISLSASNAGPDVARSVVLSNSLPVGLPVRSITLSQGTSSRAGDVFTVQLGGLPPGTNATFVIVLRPTNAVSFVNAATAVHYEKEPNLGNNSLTTPVEVLANPCVPPPSNLVNWWPAEAGANDLVGTNNGTVLGTLLYTPGKVGLAFTFNSSDDRITFANHTNFMMTSAGFTAEFWMKASNLQPQALYAVLEKSHGFADSTGWAFQGNTNPGYMSFVIGTGGSGTVNFVSTSATNNFLDNQWHHLAGVWEAGEAKLYVDGVPRATNIVVTPANNTRALNIGYAWGNNTAQRFFRGSVDEVAIYRRGLSASEIFTLYDSGMSGKCRDSFAPSIDIAPLGGGFYEVSWPGAASGFQLESALILPGPWVSVGVAPALVNDRFVVPVQATNAAQFYRLKR